VTLAQFEIIGGRELEAKYLEGVRNVTDLDVQRVAKKYLVKDQRTVGVLIPVKNKTNSN
jgi:predicted Zn-dependent peptidase